jgi:FSR family fosmidomycin resistance protein-like MFS transporter
MWGVIRAGGRPLALVAGIILLRSVATTSFATFFPTFLKNEVGTELAYAALSVTVFEVFGALGAFLGGTLSDRFGRRQMILVSQLGAAPLMFLALQQAGGNLGLVALALGGLFSLSIGSVILALIIELMPEHRGMASGLMMFLGFEGTLIATIPVGWIADQIGLGSTLMGSVWLSVLSLPLTLMLPETRTGFVDAGHGHG